MMETNKSLVLPIAIIIAGLLVAGTIYYTNKGNPPINNNIAATGETTPGQKQLKGPKEITSNDHILGDPDAPLSLIVFADLECPWCKNFHQTAMQMMNEYGKQGKIKLVFRHFPLTALHKKASKEAEATECAADLGGSAQGNEKFWQYVNRIFEITPSNDGLDPAELPKIASFVGLDKTKFTECLDSGKFSQKVQEDFNDAIASGGQGTPYFIIIDKNGEKFPFSGYLPYDQLKIILDQLLEKN